MNEVLNQCCLGYMDSEIECRWFRNSRCFLNKQGDLICLFGTACNAGDSGSIPASGRFTWRRKWQPTPVFLPGEFQGQRSLGLQCIRSQRAEDNLVSKAPGVGIRDVS